MAIIAVETDRIVVANGILKITMDYKDGEKVVKTKSYTVADSPSALNVFDTKTRPDEIAKVESAK